MHTHKHAPQHFVNNNQETDRRGVNEVVDERTRWEMYYPPFQALTNSHTRACAHARAHTLTHAYAHMNF